MDANLLHDIIFSVMYAALAIALVIIIERTLYFAYTQRQARRLEQALTPDVRRAADLPDELTQRNSLPMAVIAPVLAQKHRAGDREAIGDLIDAQYLLSKPPMARGLWLLVRIAAARLLPGRGRPWLLLYALLPLLWSLMLAHHLALGMAEGGQLLAVSVAPWLGGSAAQLPSWSADLQVIGFCQTLAVGLGLVGSVVLLRRLLLPDRLGWLLQAAVTLVMAGAGRWLVAVG